MNVRYRVEFSFDDVVGCSPRRQESPVQRFLRTCADALRERKNPPVLDAVEQALERFIATIEELRREGATRALPAENIGRLYALRFALEQLRQNFEDFRNRVTECARADRET